MSEPQPTMTCDNYRICRSSMWTQADWNLTVSIARAKGWHFYEEHILCPQCVGTSRSRLPKAPDVLEGQLELEIDT